MKPYRTIKYKASRPPSLLLLPPAAVAANVLADKIEKKYERKKNRRGKKDVQKNILAQQNGTAQKIGYSYTIIYFFSIYVGYVHKYNKFAPVALLNKKKSMPRV